MTSGNSFPQAEHGTPWYRNFWPWFIVVMLGLSIIASLASVVIAYRNRDVDVRAPLPEAVSSRVAPRVLAG